MRLFAIAIEAGGLLLQFRSLRAGFAGGSAALRAAFAASAGTRAGTALSLRTSGAGTSLTSGAALSAGTLRAVFVFGEFSVAILVEFLERLGGLGEFVGVDHAVFVQVESFDDRADGTRSAAGTTTARTASTGRAAATGTAGLRLSAAGRSAGWRIALLREDEAC